MVLQKPEEDSMKRRERQVSTVKCDRSAKVGKDKELSNYDVAEISDTGKRNLNGIVGVGTTGENKQK